MRGPAGPNPRYHAEMRPNRRRNRAIRLSILGAVIVWLAAGRARETQHLAVAVPHQAGAVAPSRLDHARMQADLLTLTSEPFAGRAPDTPGGAMAARFVADRFRALGLQAFGSTYEEPFSFEHTSIRALWRRNRPFRTTFTTTRNIVGYVPGTTRAEEIVVVSAHFDHLGRVNGVLYPGADDNASGVSALLATAAWVAEHPLAHTVVFAAFDAEELGLRGAKAFVEALPFARERLRLNINVDMIGRSDDNRLFVSGVRATPALRPLVARAALTAAVPVHIGHDAPMLMTGLTPDWTSLSDHGAFHAAGVPFLYFGVEDHADVHQPTDTADKIDAAFHAAAAEMVLSTLLEADGSAL